MTDDLDLFADLLAYQQTPEFADELASAPFDARANWHTALDFFGRRCCVCGVLKRLYPCDWIPEKAINYPGPILSNRVPMCASCIQDKAQQMPFIWLSNKLGAAQAWPILRRVQEYAKLVSA